MVRLFRAWSVVDNFRGQEQVIFNWFVVGRQTPVVPYTQLVDNYDENDNEAWCDHLLVNELFTESEIKELRTYLLNSHQLEVEAEEVLLPVKSGGLSYGLLLINGAKGFYPLADEKDYNLSISVLGHFELEEDALSELLSYEEVKTGIEFLSIVFSNLNISMAELDNLTDLLNKIYEETGLCVQKDKKRTEKINSRYKSN